MKGLCILYSSTHSRVKEHVEISVFGAEQDERHSACMIQSGNYTVFSANVVHCDLKSAIINDNLECAHIRINERTLV